MKDDDTMEFSQEELARYGEALMDRYMDILNDPDVFEYEAQCIQHHEAGGTKHLRLSCAASNVIIMSTTLAVTGSACNRLLHSLWIFILRTGPRWSICRPKNCKCLHWWLYMQRCLCHGSLGLGIQLDDDDDDDDDDSDDDSDGDYDVMLVVLMMTMIDHVSYVLTCFK